MMTNLRKIILLTLMISFVPNIAHAGISSGLDEETRLHIFSHTGQDPVYKSTIGKEIFDVPLWKKKPIETEFKIGLIDSIVQIVLSDDNWASGFATTTNEFYPDNVINTDWTNVQAITVETTSTFMFFGSNAPAPPAFVLLVGSMLTWRRRR